MTEPIENQTLDEVWETIKERKAARAEGDVSNILSGLNLTRSYQQMVEDQNQTFEEEKAHAQPVRKSP